MKSFTLKLAAAAVAAACILPGTASASGGGSGPNVQYAVQGKIGEVITNPYKIAPLTAVIRNGGYQLKDAAVRIVPKHGGAEIKYNVSDVQLRTHAGIPVFGLYPDYNNTVEVSYTLVDGTKETRVENEVYRIYAPGIHTETNGTAAQHHAMFETEVKKVAPEFKDRLYFINNFLPSGGNVARTTWNNPMGGALEWVYYPQNAVIDTAGDVRWYMFVSPIYDPENIYKSGIMMGFHQADDGFLTFGYGQRYAKYDLMGREVFNRRLPAGYADFSHAMDPAQNGHYFLRVSSADYRRPDGKRVHTVRDVILEVDQNGCAVDDFRLFDILDPYRDNVIKAMDQDAFNILRPDVVIFDVLGDVVCGGFAMPIRDGWARNVFIITSGENMAIHAAANIATAVETFAERGYARLGGIILNARDVPREAEKVEELACNLNTTIVGRLPRSAEVQEADALGLTVLEHAPSSGMADRYRELARHLVEACAATRPEPARGGFTF